MWLKLGCAAARVPATSVLQGSLRVVHASGAWLSAKCIILRRYQQVERRGDQDDECRDLDEMLERLDLATYEKHEHATT